MSEEKTVFSPENKAKKEWQPHPDFKKATLPIHEILLVIIGSNKWFQLSLLSLFFLALSFNLYLNCDCFDIYIVSLSVFYLLQAAYIRIYRGLITNVNNHYTSFDLLNRLPESEIKNYQKAEDFLNKTSQGNISSIFGIILNLILVLFSLLMDEEKGFNKLSEISLIGIWGILVSVSVIWGAIHYGKKSIGAILMMSLIEILGINCWSYSLLLLIPMVAYMMYSDRFSFANILQLFAVYATFRIFNGWQFEAYLFSPYGMYTKPVIYTICVCLIPATLLLTLKVCEKILDFQKGKKADSTELFSAASPERTMELLYSYVWGVIAVLTYIEFIAAIVQSTDNMDKLYKNKESVRYNIRH